MKKQDKNPNGEGKKKCITEGCERHCIGNDMCYACKLYAQGIIINNKPLTREEYIRRVKIVHGPNKYGYDRAQYTISKNPIKIFCYNCNEYFDQIAGAHMIGNGHKECRLGAIWKQAQWIETAKALHIELYGVEYDYSKTVYVNSVTIVKIICPQHGEFEQIANSHMQERGCNDCGRIRTAESCRKDTAYFIERATAVHFDDYDYSEVEYKNSGENVKITCNSCKRAFFQTPDNHYAGKGCSYCVKSHLEKSIVRHLFSENYTAEGSLPFATALNSNQYTDNRVFIQEQSFDSCRGERPLPFDFYIPHLRLLIEADGEQHFTANANWETDTTGLYKRIRHDNIKDQWCIDNGYWLLRIAYADKPNVMEIYTTAVWYIEEDADNIKPHVIATKFYQGLNLQHGDEVRNIDGYEFLEW
tara:strand:- start:53013 stop:54260 length:1248 start_codon:yes stop_codon:yes gene_type:complete